MKIKYKQGNLLDQTKGLIVHGCNARGVMGAGVALMIKLKYPDAYEEYRSYCSMFDKPSDALGSVVLYSTGDLKIANAITQDTYSRSGKHVDYQAIKTVFNNLDCFYEPSELSSVSVHIPKIGAGLGGGDWEIISSIIEDSIHKDFKELICWTL